MPARDRLSSPGQLGPIELGGFLRSIGAPAPPDLDVTEGFSPEQFGTSFTGLESIAADQARLQAETRAPGVVPEDLPLQEKLAVFDRADQIRRAVPGIDGAKLLSLAYHDTDVISAIETARAEQAAQPRSFWHHVAAPFKSVFIDAPEWLYRKAIVDPFQEFGELVGIDSETAQRLSPGQVLLAAVPGDFIGDIEDEFGRVRDPSEWGGTARWISGGLDLVSRLTLDPTLILGRFRQTLALPFGAEKLLGLTRVHAAGRAARVARLQNIAFSGLPADVTKAQRIVTELVEGRRGMKNYLAGYITLGDIARDAISHSGIRSFARDAVRAAQDSPDAVATLMRQYGSLRKGFGVWLEQFDYIADSARRGLLAGRIQGDEFAGGVRAVNTALAELITGKFAPGSVRRIDQLVNTHSSVVALRNDALHVIEEFHANRSVDIVDVVNNRTPRINMRGRVVAEEVELTQPGRIVGEVPPVARAAAEDIELSIPGRVQPTDDTARALARSREQAEFAEALPDVTAPIDLSPPPSRAPLPVPVTFHSAAAMTFDAYATARAAEGFTGGTRTLLQEHAFSINEALRAGRMVPREVLESTPAHAQLLDYAERHSLVAETAADVGQVNPAAQMAGTEIEASRSRRARELASPEFPPGPPGRVIPPTAPDTGVGTFVTPEDRLIPQSIPDTGAGDILPGRLQLTPSEAALSQVETAIPSDVPIPRAVAEQMAVGVERYSAEIKRVADKLRPYMNLTELDDDAIADIVHGVKSIENQLHITKPLNEFPYETVFNKTVNWLGSSSLRQVPLARNLLPEYLPHRSMNVHDPFWHVQVKRLGSLFNLTNVEVEDWLSRARNSGGPYNMRRTVEGFLDEGYQRLGVTPELMRELKQEASERTHKMFGVVDGKAIPKPILESDALNTVWLTDPKFIRLFMRRSRRGSFIGMTAEEIRTSFIDSLDRYQQIFKRLTISAPRTGLRVLMEGQARALAYGFSSAVPDPFAWFDTFGLSVLAPQRALRRLRRKAPEGVAEIRLESRDLGMNQLMFEAGVLSPNKWRDRQIWRFDEVKDRAWTAQQFRKAQAEYINDYVLNDRLAREIIFTDTDTALKWLRSPAASSYRTTMKLTTGKQIERHHDTVVKLAGDQKVLEPQIRAIVTGSPGTPGRAISAEDLIGFEADAIVGANIHGAWAGKNLQEKVSHALDLAVERNLASIEMVGRDFTTRRELYREVWDAVGKHRRAGREINDETVNTLLAGGIVPREGTHLERALVTTAKRNVFSRVKFLFFDMAEHSRASESLRFLFPFGNAFQEVVSRWGAILAERPWVPHLGAAMFEASDDLPGLTYTDPATGEKMFRIPLAGHLLRFAGLRSPNPISGMPGELGFELTGRLEGFNMVTSGFPIPGPYAQITSWFLLRNKPAAQDVLTVLFPYGMGSWMESLQPGYMREMRNFLDTYLDSDLSNVDLASVAADLGTEEIYSIIKKANAVEDPVAARDALATVEDIDEGRFLNKLRFLFSIRAASRVFFPAVVRERSPYRDLIDFYRSISQTDPGFANAVFLARYGPEFLALVEERTEITKANTPPPTKEARQRLLTDPALNKFVSVFGQPAWDVLKETWAGELDSDMLRDQILSGERRRRTLPEIRQAALAAVGWEYFFLYSDQIERRMSSLGIANLQQSEAKPFQSARNEFISKLRMAFPDWAQEFATGRGSKMPVNLSRLSIIANVPQLQGLESIVGLKKYFGLRAQIIRHMNRLGLASLSSEAALPMKASFQDQVREIVRAHPAFARLWGRYLQRDDMTPLNELLLQTGLVDQAGFLREVA